MSLLELREIEVSYPGRAGTTVKAVAGADLSVEAGQIVALVGESGCGKSSLGKAAVGLLAPSAGTVTFLGEPVTPLGRAARPPAQRRLQMVFQDPYSSLNPRRRVGDQIGDGIRVSSEPRTGAGRRAEEYLERVGLDAAAAARFPHQFSGGQRQRIALARALASRPLCIVADEPISALDASAQASIATLMVDLVDDLRVGLLFISHDLAIVRQIADRTAVMYLGEIVELSASARLWSSPIHPYSEGLIGAIPRPDGRGHVPDELPGDVPDPAMPPTGCRFHPRCPVALPQCAIDSPEPRPIGRDGHVACHRAAERLDPSSKTE